MLIVKKEVKYFYEGRPKDEVPSILTWNIDFQSLTLEENINVIEKDEEIKDWEWNCDSNKTLGSNGFNFMFIIFFGKAWKMIY